MKTQLNSSLLCIFFVVISGLATVKAGNGKAGIADSAVCVNVKGKLVFDRENPKAEFTVDLYSKGRVIETLTTREGEAFVFQLGRNDNYTIRISHPDYASKLVVVNTEFPDEIHDVLDFSFKTDLITKQAARGMNGDALDFPIALVHFDEKTEMFTFNEEYTRQLKREIVTPKVSDSSKLLARE